MNAKNPCLAGAVSIQGRLRERGAMGIREDQEAQAAKFISVRNILIGLSDLESVSVSEVASYLLRKMELAEEEKPQFIRQDRQSTDTPYQRGQ